ncbi:unnamed protein product [Rotaria sp. Silwood1]|nr:unnamed protein product [Rotaria sp. Silwood1]CAF4509132.1 unnamed protein product [Rotaria sp. Silwood1]
MAATQPAYDYSAYDYSYDTSSSSAYSSYPGYETGTSYAPPGTYDSYAASATYPTSAASASSPYTTVDPYSGYPATAYGYPTTATSAGAPPATASQASYPPSYGSSPTATGYAYDSRRLTPPPTASAAAHYASYDYTSSAAGAYIGAPPSSAAYSPYKSVPTTNGSSSTSAYAAYPSSAPPPHGTYGVPPSSHLQGAIGAHPPPSHVYGPPPPAAGMISRRPDYYPPPQMPHSMHYVPHQTQPMHYRLPPRGGYQRELDEPGDENVLLRHVIYITGLPKEIQNETLAEVFGAACGPIAPVDVRSPKPKIWVYKDRQTREGKGEATITFINPESCQTAINYFNGKELFGREIRVTLCPRRMYNMQKQNTPFNPAAPPMNTTTMVKPITNNNGTTTTTDNTTTTTTTTTSAATNTTSTTTSTTTPVATANPIATISSSTHGLSRQLNHSLFKLRQTPEQQRGLLPTPPIPFGAPIIGNAVQRDDIARATRASNACYGEYGCFTTGKPFGGTLQRPFALLPDPSGVIDTKFYLYTRATRKNRTEISRYTTLGAWSSSKPTKVCIHGFADSMNTPWWIDMKNAMLEVEDVNVILVDWSKGNGFPYEKATANTQMVGAEIAFFINYLIAEHGSKATDFHIIGHSLGAQTAGYAGARIPGLGRITGLDPAGPYFEDTDPTVRLDPTDALFVDVIHTDGAHNLLLGLGTLQRMGHVDFYPNGGFDQPRCSKTPGKILNLILQLGTMNVEGFLVTSVCSHLAAVYFFTDSIRNECPYVGYSCSNFDDFNSGKCSLQCDGKTHQCNRMGYWTSPTGGKGDLYLKTQDANAFPYCINHYQITLQSGSDYSQTRGKVTITLIGSVNTVTVTFDDDQTTFKRGSVENRFIPLTVDIGEVRNIDLDFKKTNNIISSSWYSNSWTFTKATILNGDTQNSRSFCPTQSIITSGSKLRFTPC